MYYFRLDRICQVIVRYKVCKVFVTVDVNSSAKPVIYCRAKSSNQEINGMNAFWRSPGMNALRRIRV